jgi:hypothetical protein
MRLMLSGSWALLFAVAVVAAQSPADGLAELQWMAGEWHGVGEGDPGTSGTERHVDIYLDGNYIRVTGRSVYPKQEKSPKGEIHEQFNLWSYDRARKAIVMREFDTLGFVGTYVQDKSVIAVDRWVLVAESLENVPGGWKARYIVTRKSEDEYHEVLELDADGKGFKPYVTNHFLKVTKRGE